MKQIILDKDTQIRMELFAKLKKELMPFSCYYNTKAPNTFEPCDTEAEMRRMFTHYGNTNDRDFINELKAISQPHEIALKAPESDKSKIKRLLESDLRDRLDDDLEFYIRNGGNSNEWIKHTNKILKRSKGLSVKTLVICDVWIKEKQGAAKVIFKETPDNRIFPTDRAFTIFDRWVSMKPAKHNDFIVFCYKKMIDDKLATNVKDADFKDFMYQHYKIDIDKLKTLTALQNSSNLNQYGLLIDLIQ